MRFSECFSVASVSFFEVYSREIEDLSRRNEGPQKDSSVSLLLDWLITGTHLYGFKSHKANNYLIII